MRNVPFLSSLTRAAGAAALAFTAALAAVAGAGGLALAPVAEAAPPVLETRDCAGLRLPAVPLVTHDPFFSAWSRTDTLNASWPAHWTGANFGLCVMLAVDGKPYVLCGDPQEKGVARAEQTAVRVSATRTQYVFNAGGVEAALTFTSPLLIDDLDALSRPATYLHVSAANTTGAAKKLRLYADVTGEWAVHFVRDNPRRRERSQRVRFQNISAKSAVADILAIGNADPKILGRAGDFVRIDWGRLLFAADKRDRAAAYTGDVDAARARFIATGALPPSEPPTEIRAASDRWPGLAYAFDLGTAAAGTGAAPAERLLVLAYNDDYSIQYFGKNLRPWWNRDGKLGDADLVALAFRDAAPLAARAAALDTRIAGDALAAGGRRYADLCIAAYRQVIAAHKLVAAPDGRPLFFSKENASNGSIGTIDVTYPSFPIFALYNTTLARALCDFMFEYVESGRWTKPFAPHDIGKYPLANGQRYNGDMPVEESANMLVCASLIARREATGDYLRAHLPTLKKWADYLVENGFDPANQLCTDDFAGRFPRNTNLSLKTITALGAFADALRRANLDPAAATRYRAAAVDMAKRWPDLARDGDHYALVFGGKNTWSLKYNIVWDKLLRLGLFSPEIMRAEHRLYLAKTNRYGVPLDNRKTYTKSDWIVWVATIAEDKATFDALIEPVWRYVNETKTRVPLCDWHWTDTGLRKSFHARSVIGGYWLPVLAKELAKEPA
ncbi:MAG: DUF4965 domain-containing protein, partial [Puniceicoccales bacterium]|nr:DUF4965 domain-containing protein [Puniceicoccales bacterium]